MNQTNTDEHSQNGDHNEGKKAKKPERKMGEIKYPPLSGFGPPETSKDPLIVLKDIIKDKEIEDDGEKWLLEYSVTRFRNRRRMAYFSLYGLLVLLAFLLIFAIIDGQSACLAAGKCTGVMKSLSEVEGLLSWISGFLAGIVATYYGMSSFRPSS